MNDLTSIKESGTPLNIATPLPDGQTVTDVKHWTDKLFSFRLTRPQSLARRPSILPPSCEARAPFPFPAVPSCPPPPSPPKPCPMPTLVPNPLLKKVQLLERWNQSSD